jgi:hypothetical protein
MWLTASVQASGLTLWSLTDQVTGIDERNSISGRLGYSFATENGGLEGFIGSTWYQDEKYPQVMSLGIIEHLPDLVDPNNPLPWIPDVLVSLLNEDVHIGPYIGLMGTFQFIEEDAGMYGIIAGAKVKVSPNSLAEWVVEYRYIDPFGQLDGVEKSQLSAGLRIPF